MFCFFSRTNGGGPRVKIFLRVPGDEKSGSLPGVKIQNYNSHIQGKLARLNAAITEGLRNDQLKRENASQMIPATMQLDLMKGARERTP